jgi:hypothetical protein
LDPRPLSIENHFFTGADRKRLICPKRSTFPRVPWLLRIRNLPRRIPLKRWPNVNKLRGNAEFKRNANDKSALPRWWITDKITEREIKLRSLAASCGIEYF